VYLWICFLHNNINNLYIVACHCMIFCVKHLLNNDIFIITFKISIRCSFISILTIDGLYVLVWDIPNY